jgi:hypothetical protein
MPALPHFGAAIRVQGGKSASNAAPIDANFILVSWNIVMRARSECASVPPMNFELALSNVKI